MLEDEFADEIFSSGGESLEQIVGYFLQMRGATLSVAESCTGGLPGRAPHARQRLVALLHRGSAGLLQRPQDGPLRNSAAAAGQRQHRVDHGGRGAGGRHPRALQHDAWHRNHRDRGPEWRLRRKASRAGLHCVRQRAARPRWWSASFPATAAAFAGTPRSRRWICCAGNCGNGGPLNVPFVEWGFRQRRQTTHSAKEA